jgi:hypothetical protein
MSWETIRASYPPDTWLLLEIKRTTRTLEWQYCEAIRVLEVLALDSDPLTVQLKHLPTVDINRTMIATTSHAVLAEQVGGYDQVEPDGRLTPVCIVDMRPPRDRRPASQGGSGYSGGNDRSERS